MDDIITWYVAPDIPINDDNKQTMLKRSVLNSFISLYEG